jgi:hypothetical protein
VYNIQKAVSRLGFAPKLKEIQVTDFQKGLGVFTPKPDKPVSFAALKETLKKAGYTLASADITVAGKLVRDEKRWAIVVQASGQRFTLEGPNIDQALAGSKEGDAIELTGNWKLRLAKQLRVVVPFHFPSLRRWASRNHQLQKLFLRCRIRPASHP